MQLGAGFRARLGQIGVDGPAQPHRIRSEALGQGDQKVALAGVLQPTPARQDFHRQLHARGFAVLLQQGLAQVDQRTGARRRQQDGRRRLILAPDHGAAALGDGGKQSAQKWHPPSRLLTINTTGHGARLGLCGLQAKGPGTTGASWPRNRSGSTRTPWLRSSFSVLAPTPFTRSDTLS